MSLPGLMLTTPPCQARGRNHSLATPLSRVQSLASTKADDASQERRGTRDCRKRTRGHLHSRAATAVGHRAGDVSAQRSCGSRGGASYQGRTMCQQSARRVLLRGEQRPRVGEQNGSLLGAGREGARADQYVCSGRALMPPDAPQSASQSMCVLLPTPRLTPGGCPAAQPGGAGCTPR